MSGGRGPAPAVRAGRSPSSLAVRWRTEAAALRRRGAAGPAETLESCAAELEEYERERDLEALTLDEAAAVSGYTYSALEKMVREGRIPNAGEPHRPRVRRGDLPKKPHGGNCSPRVEPDGPDLAELVLAARR